MRLAALVAADTGWADVVPPIRLPGEYAPMDLSQRTRDFKALVRLFPIGPISMISPFNFPLNLAAHKIAPAIAVG